MQTDRPAAAPHEAVLDVEGVVCGACVARVESALRGVEGVREASLNLATRRARVAWDPARTSLDELRAAIARAGYRAREHERDDAADRAARRTALWRVSVAGFAMMQIMMFSTPVYLADEGTMTWDIERLLAIASLVLTVPVLVFSAVPIFQGAWRGLLARRPGMDLPVAIGVVVSFVASVYATFAGGDLYYDSIAMFVFFLLLGRYFEAGALARTAGAAEALAELLPRRAQRLVDGHAQTVDPVVLVPGDLVAIAAGEAAPADAVVVEGRSDFDEALLTGESAPVAKRAGDLVLAGTVNLAAPVTARVERRGEDQTLSHVRRLMERAASEKPHWALLADRVATRFVLGVLALAAAGAIAWLWIDPSRALWIGVATLVVSCPCALSLATPVALTAAVNALSRRGVLVTRGRAIEALASATHVVFDKTGTLTTGRMRLAAVEVLGGESRERCLAIAAALESAMPHPMAHALVASRPREPVIASGLRAVPGSGVEARVKGTTYRVGSPDFCAGLCGTPFPLPVDAAEPLAAMSDERGWLAVFRFEDTPRPEAADLVRRLRSAGLEVALLSGDRPAVVERIAAELGIAARIAGSSPEEKAAHVERLAAGGATVVMVGDGVNDAPVLARAQVAIALAQGAALAQSQADLVILSPSITAVAESIEVAGRARRVIRQNIAWAIGYNALALPLALTGLLTPWLASLGMSVSSLAVVANALRLLRAPGTGAAGPAPDAVAGTPA